MPNQVSMVATGRSMLGRSVSSDQLAARLDVEVEWIRRRLGIESRLIAPDDVAVSDLAIDAGSRLLSRVQRDQEPGLLLLATSTPDHLLPPTAPLVAEQLGLTVPAMDITVACCGFLYGMILAESIVLTSGNPVLLIAANILSRRCDPSDRATAALFADGAGAVLLAAGSDGTGILATSWNSDGGKWSSLLIPDGGSRSPFNADTFDHGRQFMKFERGDSLFRAAVEAMASEGHAVLEKSSLSIEDVDWWVPHQASLRIIEATRKQLKIDQRKTLVTIDRFGNSSAATIPVTLDYFMHTDPRIKPGQLILMTAAAAGMTSAAVLLRT